MRRPLQLSVVIVFSCLLVPAARALNIDESCNNRRSFIRHVTTTSFGAATCLCGPLLVPSSNANAAEPTAPLPTGNPMKDKASELESGLLEARVTENVLSPPPYGLEVPDIVYPTWFDGRWDVYSETTSVEAPCGIPLFGGNSTFASAKKEIGPGSALRYKARFIEGAPGIIADREYNVREIVKQAMGENAVQDVSMATPNKFSCLLAPAGAGQILSVDLLTLARRQEIIDGKNFHCSEVVRQVVAPINQGKPQMTPLPSQQPGKTVLLKEIETTSLYSLESDNKIRCLQRSATFLLPSQQDPVAYQLWQLSRGRPIDVRFYDVTYTKKL
eukprot:CAMPEP_0178699486 /NCGR_PEP_ID=MMETSP0699-20121125/11099_1 /TAXON_ID=265572 /ORGANISM="Extubocellulus spinifer, Strain CCMP396" /LENGTH=329 /DNA_ID=CAMNT_0020345623 /DNA_START=1992 /DNA_END=2981 /DNA_ORIENTATION=+